MTRRRRVLLEPRVCIGVFLLLFSAICADTTKEPPSTSERSFLPETAGASISESKETVVNKTPLKDETDSSSTERRTNSSTPTEFKATREELTKDAQAENTENASRPIDEVSNSQEIRSSDQLDRLSTADLSSGGSKLEEVIYGTPGKSSSTKTVSEDFSRLSRTNGLTPVTTKPSLDESKNKTVQPLNNITKPSSKTLKDPEGVPKLKKDKEQPEKTEGKNNVESQLETIKATNDSTVQGSRFLDRFLVEKRTKTENLNPVKNSEVPDLKDADEDENDGSISLANDTNVNYSQLYKTTTESNVDTKPEIKSGTSEGTPSVVTHEVDPKDEVEVVGNVTHPASQRIVERQSQNFPKDTSLVNEVNGRDTFQNATRTIETIDAKSMETSTLAQGLSSPVPRGRTIAFPGVNEFPGLESKPTATSFRKDITERPYPYIKSSIKDQLPNSSNEVDAATEEPSALQNTIGKGQSDEKFIVTEASDVLENSIQQFKPTYHEKAINESSTVPSAEVRPSVPMTTASVTRLEETTPMNQTVIDDPNGVPSQASSNEGNDVPRWNEAHQQITGKGGFDVTGNGITEVTLKSETDKQLQEITGRTTLAPLTTPPIDSRTDPQTNAGGSLSLLRSTLNASERSTEYPLVKGDSSDKEITAPGTTVRVTDGNTVVPTAIEESFTANTTAAATVVDVNGNNEIPSGASGTVTPDESFLSTTTSIEYEFVGLTESTTFSNGTETGDSQSAATTVLPTVHDVIAKSVPVEVTTLSNEITTDAAASTETDVTSVDDRVSSTPVVESTTVPQDTTVESDRGTSNGGDIERTTSAAVDAWTTITPDENLATTTMGAEQTISSDSKDFGVAGNATESSVEFTTISNVNATEGTRVATSIIPFIPSSLRPRVPDSSSTPSASTPTASDSPVQKTDDTMVVTQEEKGITSLVRIDMEGGWYDVCPKMNKLKLSLVEVLRSGMNRSVSDKQIMFHQDPCQESPSSTSTPSDVPLTSILVYVVDENGKFDGAMTKILPTLYEDFKERVQFPITIHRILLVQEPIPDSGNAIAVVVVSSVAFICLVLLAGLLFIMRKRQTRFNYGERCRPVSLDAYSLDSVSAYNSVRRKGVARSSKRSYGNPTFEDSSAIPSHPLNFAGLSSFCNDVNAINEEFAGIPQVSAKIDELPTGAELKNRYANVIPLPETRVPLQKINNDPLTEYINASYVRGPKNALRYYIACQAPMESTVTDFWRMIWEQQCKVVIMLTDLVENGVEKCTEYVPPSEITDCHRLYGDYQVTLKKRETKEKYAISTLHLKNLENNTFREVYHIWYLWPVNGVQSDGAGLIAVLLEARALQRGGPGPIVVHCSPGTGRTGTLIALDLGIRQYEITRTVDVPRVVYTIRRDRAGSVQTKEQYAFVYKALNLYATKLAGGVLEST